MLHSRVHQNTKVQSNNLMSYPPISSRVVHYVSAPVWNGDYFYQKTTFLSVSLLQMAHSSLKITVKQDVVWVIMLIHVSIQQFMQQKLGDMASLSSLSSCGLTLLIMAYKALVIIPASTTLGNVEWKWQLLCCVNLNCFWVCTVWVYDDFLPYTSTSAFPTPIC
jgi:hypothetical protein